MSAPDEMALQLAGQKVLLDAKMNEFGGFLMMGLADQAEKARNEAHTLLEQYFDAQVEMIQGVKSGKLK